MAEKRYYVYISTSFEHVKAERMKLQVALIDLNMFPWEFNDRRTSLNTALIRKQIDESDYVIFLIGAKYGDLSASGISYPHLDFLYAMSKQKNIICFVDALVMPRPAHERETNLEIQRKFHDFKLLLKKEVKFYYEFTNTQDLERNVKKKLQQIFKDEPAVGWVRPKSNGVLHNEIVRLKQQNAELKLELEKNKYQATPVMTSNGVMQVNTPMMLSKTEKFVVQYRTHAYQDGNLKELYPQREMTWHQILKVLASHFTTPAIEANFQRVLNYYLENTALADARESLPRVHAVARTQIDEHCLQQIKLQMKWNNWIVPELQGKYGNRNYWQLTQEGQRQLTRVNV